MSGLKPEMFAVRHKGEWYLCHQVGPSEMYEEESYKVSDVMDPMFRDGPWIREWCEAVVPLRFDPSPVRASDWEWWSAYRMCGGCGSADCHKGPCTEVPGIEQFDGHRRTVCGKCPNRQDEIA